MACPVLSGSENLPARSDIMVERSQFRGVIFEIRDLLVQQVFGLVAKQVAYPGAHKGITLSEIYNQDQIRKALQQSPAEFFLLKQFPLHLSLVSNIDQRALVADHVAGGVPHRARGIEKKRGSTVLALELNLPRAHGAAVPGSTAQNRRLTGIEIQVTRVQRKQFFLLLISQQANQSWVGIQKIAVGCAEIHSLLQSLEQFGEAQLLLALLSDVSSQHTHAHHLIALDDAIEHAIEVERPGVIFQHHTNRARPMFPFQKTAEA